VLWLWELLLAWLKSPPFKVGRFQLLLEVVLLVHLLPSWLISEVLLEVLPEGATDAGAVEVGTGAAAAAAAAGDQQALHCCSRYCSHPQAWC